MIIDGKAITHKIFARLREKPAPSGALVAILVGDNPASVSFVRQKEIAARELGIWFDLRRLPAQTSDEELAAVIEELNRSGDVCGIVLQLPLPPHLDRDRAVQAILISKDVDQLHASLAGSVDLNKRFLPPAAGVVKEITYALHIPLGSSSAAVVGANGFLVGRPVSQWLAGRVARLAEIEIDSFDAPALASADLIVSGVGKPGLITGNMVKKGSVLVDFGYGMKSGKISGDFEFESCEPVASLITPTPGGTGPILVAKLMENFYILPEQTA